MTDDQVREDAARRAAAIQVDEYVTTTILLEPGDRVMLSDSANDGKPGLVRVNPRGEVQRLSDGFWLVVSAEPRRVRTN